MSNAPIQEHASPLSRGRALRDGGIRLIEQARRDWIERARQVAADIAREHGTVTINDVRAAMVLPDGWSPNTWGAVLKHPMFKPVAFGQAHHPAAHARTVRVYQLSTKA